MNTLNTINDRTKSISLQLEFFFSTSFTALDRQKQLTELDKLSTPDLLDLARNPATSDLLTLDILQLYMYGRERDSKITPLLCESRNFAIMMLGVQ